MDYEKIKKHIQARREHWAYGDRYSIQNIGSHRIVAKVGDELAGIAYAKIRRTGKEAEMKMNLKKEFAEYGIGTELLAVLMEDLIDCGFEIIRYEISKERYAFQIYQMLELKVESQDSEKIKFIWKKRYLHEER